MPDPVFSQEHGSSIRLSLLGGFRLLVGAEELRPSMAEQRLIVLLALERRPQQRSHIAGTLWPESGESRASASLRTTLWRLRRLTSGLIETRPAWVSLGPGVHVDVHEMVEMCQELPSSPRDLNHEITRFLDKDLLPDWYDDWLLIERERVRQLRLHTLERIAVQLARSGRFTEAVEASLLAIAGEPLRESAHRTLIQVHLEEGNTFEALRQYRYFSDLLERELGVEPSPAMERAIRSIDGTLTRH